MSDHPPRPRPPHSLEEVHRTVRLPASRRWRRLFAFVGPAYLVSVGYMDPGNWATDLEGGARFGYALIWVLLMSNGMAVLLQTLSARLGLVTGRDLAQACHDDYPPWISCVLFVLCEVAITACDLAEVLGSAVGINLLFGIVILATGGDAPKELVSLCRASGIDLLVVGGHGHRGPRDWLHGQTIPGVRHGLKIPVLTVRA